jgi:hypothetical protein
VYLLHVTVSTFLVVKGDLNALLPELVNIKDFQKDNSELLLNCCSLVIRIPNSLQKAFSAIHAYILIYGSITRWNSKV